ncbi:MAG TPA: YbhB/YbcL family Raf kinase inhibitor-like protein [bacterium]|nr:YbhB/YbcL family Raf kinase inhibitor-like protein [bacterium]
MAHIRHGIRGIALLAVCAGLAAPAAGAGTLTVSVGGVKPDGPIPREFAFCARARQGHVTFAGNRNPAISWSGAPAGTKSYAIIVVDPDVPSVFTDANVEGKVLPATLKRMDFYHWVLVDIASGTTALPAGADSNGITPRGKKAGPAKFGVRGINDYTKGFAGDPKMEGDYGGYDGPCPPWNDEIVHHYHFAVYALDVAKLDLPGKFTGPEALKAMTGHIVAQGEVIGLYATNPDVAAKWGIP